MFKPDKRLKTQYDKANKLFWDGELPQDTVIGWNDGLIDTVLGMTLGVSDEETNHTFFHIHIHSDIKRFRSVWLMTLMHEMAHVKLHPYMKHGRKFNEELHRICGRGAFDGLW